MHEPTAAFPEIADLAPHAGPMRLLACVLEHDATSTTCRVEPGRHALFLDDAGAVPALVGLEYMAQCVAVHAGLEGAGAEPRVGFLLGTRSLELHRARLHADETFEVSVRHLRGRPGLGAMSFACELRVSGDGSEAGLVAEATLSVALARPGTDVELPG